MSRHTVNKPLRFDTESFIAAARAVHGERYDYSRCIFSGTNKKVAPICATHGLFEIPAYRHLNGAGCPKCAGKVRKTTEEFVAEARAIHGDRYDYSRVVYRNNSTLVEILCPEHGPFFPKPLNHLVNKSGCPACAGCKPTTLEDFLARAQAAQGDRSGAAALFDMMLPIMLESSKLAVLVSALLITMPHLPSCVS
jgi:hypothetical protein